MNYYSDEIGFISKLIDKYSIWLTHEDNIRRVEKVKTRLAVLNDFKGDLIHGILKHMSHIKNLMENPFSHEDTVVRDEHGRLQDDFADFFKALRGLKKEAFSLTGAAIDREGIYDLLH